MALKVLFGKMCDGRGSDIGRLAINRCWEVSFFKSQHDKPLRAKTTTLRYSLPFGAGATPGWSYRWGFREKCIQAYAT